MLVLSITSMKPPPLSPTLTFSPCLITLLNMALSGLKLWGCTSQIPLRNGCSQVPLASMTAQTLIFPATVKLLFLLSLNATFAANSRSLNLRNSLSPGRLKMKRYWIPLPALPTHWEPLTVSLVSHLLDNFSTVVWLGLATCWRRTSERTLSVGSLHVCLLSHAVSPSPGLVKLPRALQSTGMR